LTSTDTGRGGEHFSCVVLTNLKIGEYNLQVYQEGRLELRKLGPPEEGSRSGHPRAVVWIWGGCC